MNLKGCSGGSCPAHKTVFSQPNSATNGGHQESLFLAYRVFSSKAMGWVGEEVGNTSLKDTFTVPPGIL